MKRKIIIFGILAVVVSIIVIVLVNSTFLVIDSGHRGILFRTFAKGVNKKVVYSPGFHLVAP
jgi:hypothetical protein